MLTGNIRLIIFLILAVITIMAGITMVSSDNLARSIYAHVLALISIAGIYILLYAEFMAGVQILVYAGGISIMLLFALMLTKPYKGIFRALDHPAKFPAIIAAGSLAAIFLFSIHYTDWSVWPIKIPYKIMNAEVIGGELFIKYILPFEIVSLILLVALIGAVVIGSKKE
ncbi:MAG: NADH-quinone oxidoreductase subunit J [bacterium]